LAATEFSSPRADLHAGNGDAESLAHRSEPACHWVRRRHSCAGLGWASEYVDPVGPHSRAAAPRSTVRAWTDTLRDGPCAGDDDGSPLGRQATVRAPSGRGQVVQLVAEFVVDRWS